MAETKKTIDPAAEAMLDKAAEMGIDTAFDRVDELKPCPIGAKGICCKNCAMGPCRLTKEGQVGICGATVETVAARNLARAIAAGSAAHSDHGRDMAFVLHGAATGEAPGYQIRDEFKLREVAIDLGVEIGDRTKEEIAVDVAEKALAQFGKQSGELTYLARAPRKRQEIWKDLGIAPRGIDREIVEILHRTVVGNDQDPEHILDQGMRAALGDGWGGSMLATDISDILFGTPSPLVTQVNLGVLKEDEVNIVIHGHEPTLSEMVVAAARDPEMIEYAKSKGANGITLAGICCTSNETLMRQGVPAAGNFLHQELAVLTGAVEAMVVDVQCVFQGLQQVAENFHTKLITTSPKAMITGALHMEFDEHRAPEIARDIVKTGVDNFSNRGATYIPDVHENMVPGFSHEYIRYMLGGYYRGSLRPLNDAIMAGRLRGVAGVVGCNNPRAVQDEAHFDIVKEFLKNDVLVVQTGCGALCNAKYGLLQGEALKHAGPGLREICEAVGIPPVLHMGSCVDNSRILTVLSEMATEGGLGEDISDIPGVGIAPEWMSEKALAIGTYFVASGAYVIFGVKSPVEGSEAVTDLINSRWEEKVGGKLEFEPDPKTIVKKSLDHIDKKRAALGLPEYDPARFGESGDRRFNAWLKARQEGVEVSPYSMAGVAVEEA
ncbi:MAG: anaerobic carbon-monoxide dehydrogenase catalytic subunit [Anaerolineae bacterium]|nr:anaerobic carbon-monoxide dehydrogenase catalytic subunit [Anaerolineae bacterium]NIN95919.1 anaerobic carbon-monoxide dehydrogenase catalytic subunit [Anaerolineae bacterium]NIQ78883.1 anaerobic carbon-monoxide dehydrogenase catalytic subunit [Anaerolineae bacterium]